MASSAGQKRRVGSLPPQGLDQGQPLGGEARVHHQGGEGGQLFPPEATAGGGGFAPAPPRPRRRGSRRTPAWSPSGRGENRRSSQWPSGTSRAEPNSASRISTENTSAPCYAPKGRGEPCPGRFISPASASGTGRCRRLHTGPPLRGAGAHDVAPAAAPSGPRSMR